MAVIPMRRLPEYESFIVHLPSEAWPPAATGSQDLDAGLMLRMKHIQRRPNLLFRGGGTDQSRKGAIEQGLLPVSRRRIEGKSSSKSRSIVVHNNGSFGGTCSRCFAPFDWPDVVVWLNSRLVYDAGLA